MKTNVFLWVTTLALFATLAIPVSAQQPRYKLIDMGTFGGPASEVNNGGDGNNSVNVLNNRDELVGWAETPKHDPFDPACLDEACKIVHAFEWHNGTRTDLGTLAKGVSSQANWISANGLVAGLSENGKIDPLFQFPETHAVLWQKGRITDLGTLPEGGYESFGNAVNSAGQVVGLATNTIPDKYSMAGPHFFPTESRAFLWQKGVMQDLGTLGGPDAQAAFVNERGQVVGWSYTSSAPNTSCPFFLPLATGSFIWDEKNGMRDLGTLGGTCVIATGVNDQGVIVGDNVNDQPLQRAFLWREGVIQDLGGSIGGAQAGAEGISQSGQVIGFATLAGEILYHATLWRRVGEITDLGVLPGDLCSFASSINSKSQVVGASQVGTPHNGCSFNRHTSAFLWDNGSIYDLNKLIPPGASLHLQWAEAINDRGEIAGSGLRIINGKITKKAHVFLLIPCHDDSDCQEVIFGASEAAEADLPVVTQQPQVGNPSHSIRQMLRRRMLPLSRALAPTSGLGAAKVDDNLGPVEKPGITREVSGDGRSAQHEVGAEISSCSRGEQGASNGEVPGITVHGECSVNENTNTLTGYCQGALSFSHTCAGGRDASQCPSGQKAEMPEWVTCGNFSVVRLDVKRSCVFQFQ